MLRMAFARLAEHDTVHATSKALKAKQDLSSSGPPQEISATGSRKDRKDIGSEAASLGQLRKMGVTTRMGRPSPERSFEPLIGTLCV
jgi:hypothetical protein